MGIYMLLDQEVVEFDWDEGNKGKNREHGVEDSESEEPFFDGHKVILEDPLHSLGEERFLLIGKTKKGRLLYVVFTKRKKRIRIISARALNRKEKHLYEKET